MYIWLEVLFHDIGEAEELLNIIQQVATNNILVLHWNEGLNVHHHDDYFFSS